MDSNTLPHMDQAKISRIARRKKQLTHLERLCVRPWVAEQLLSIGHKQLYHLLQTNQLESFKEGKARKITLASIEAYIARKLEMYPTKPKHARSE